ncbi:MAG TPA: DICT sensory domain-containing protein [Pyrinomonadaceae bacterium]|nr:DICT sensory domain-containing protein [Pyrinomonadaceae bacterium]
MHTLAVGAAVERAEEFGTVAHVSRRDYAEHQTFAFGAPAPVLEYLSLLIENSLLLRTHRGGRVYACFQKLSRMEPVVDRYMRIADVSERVYAFGEDDWRPPRHPNLRAVALPEGARLAREWFVVADSPSMSAALVALEEDGAGTASPDPSPDLRQFRALKTSDPSLVRRLAEAAESLAEKSLPQ